MNLGIKNRTASWKADDWKACLVLVGGFVLLAASAFLGEIHRKNHWGETNQEAGKMVFTSAEGAALPQEEREFLRQLETFMAGASVHQAAARLAEEHDRLCAVRASVSHALDRETLYLCDGNPVSSLNGMGLAIVNDNTYFYGNFREGKPEGVCTAISCSPGQYLNYEYSMGIWKDGQMEGLGITGKYSHSWKHKEDGRGMEEQTSGIFQEDRLHGRLTYEQIDHQGRSCWWEITAEEGKTCLDQRWVFWKALGEYRLLSEKEKRAFFVIPQNLLERVWWENRVPWE